MSITTSHSLAKELLNKPDGAITMRISDEEYLISHIKRNEICANLDDTSTYWTLNGEYKCSGNIKR